MLEILYNLFLSGSTISTDSRTCERGSIFFALSGDNFNGNKFALSALERGAALAVVDDKKYALDKRFLLVNDVFSALQDLAEYHRSQLKIPVLAISGSNGKTTTKELLGAVLSKKYKVSMTRGNLNNHIGVPLTLLSINPQDEFAIVEMGASHCGEIKLLCQIAKPDFGLLTNVGRAHLEGFGGVQGVINAKGELFDALAGSCGVAFYRIQDELISDMVKSRSNLNALGYSSEISLPKSKLVGDYNLYNVAAAVAVGKYFGVSYEDISDAIENYEPTNNRSQKTVTERNTLIVDCYNANPSSIESALKNFARQTDEHKIVILGDMFELGAYCDTEHLKVLHDLESVGASRVIVVGENFAKAALNYQPQNYDLSSYANCSCVVSHEKFNNSLILLKGSRGVGLEKLIEYL